MSTKQTANLYIINNSGGNAAIQLTHQYSSDKPETGAWQAAPGKTVGPLVVHFETGPFTGLDWWWLNVQVKDGPNKGNYSSRGDFEARKECELHEIDANKNITCTVDTTNFRINRPSGACSASMIKTSQYSPVTNVFVLMLENHSFDVVFGNSKITGRDSRTGKQTTVNGLAGNETNVYKGIPYKVQPQTRDPLVSDPGHEFDDTVEQLCGEGQTYDHNDPYPKINNSGFAANYATTKSEGPPAPPPAANIGDIMGAYNSAQVNILYWLASHFMVCDNWCSSIPGPTWPNRFFAMGASSEGVDFSPPDDWIAEWELPAFGFYYEHGSLFELLNHHGLHWRLYGDIDDQFSPRYGSIFGSIPIATALRGITIADAHSFAGFSKDLLGVYPYQFTWIEPNYGDVSKNYQYGSSQHPMDSLNAGQEMLYVAYNALLNSPLWATSLLIVTYDEHGGYYDHVAPPPAIAPGDSDRYKEHSKDKFDFKQYGVRVPAVVVSPLIPSNTIDHTLYDHTSIAKTLESLFGLPGLTARDANANDLSPLLTGALRTERLEAPLPPKAPEPDLAAAMMDDPALDLQLLPAYGNINGAVVLAMKAEVDLSDGSVETKAAIKVKAETIKTKGDARRYIREVVAKADVVRKARRAAMLNILLDDPDLEV